MSRDKVSWAEAPWWRKIIGGIILGCTVLLFAGLGVSSFLDRFFPGTQVCTVDSARLRNSSGGNGGATASRSVRIESSDCGLIVITSVRYSGDEDMNEAALVEFLQEHQGEKFEFVTNYVQFPSGLWFPDSLGSQGIASTEPVK
ncbi:hypothetical protein [Rothia nasimurium]|uniref:hypothetical protein n=1 Tax=Rothia nasimurium TaxID=85336 RepID=UPI001F1C912B|nr:hypothetical protein [Rothia nasimurium]